MFYGRTRAVSPRCRQRRPGRRLQEQMREEDSGLDCGPITSEACQGPLGTRVLINALSDGVSTTRRPEQRKEGEERLPRTMNIRHSLVVMENHLHTRLFFFFFIIPHCGSDFLLLFLRCPHPPPRLAPPTIVGHELLINLGDRKDITVLCCALTCLFCKGSLLLPKG